MPGKGTWPSVSRMISASTSVSKPCVMSQSRSASAPARPLPPRRLSLRSSLSNSFCFSDVTLRHPAQYASLPNTDTAKCVQHDEQQAPGTCLLQWPLFLAINKTRNRCQASARGRPVPDSRAVGGHAGFVSRCSPAHVLHLLPNAGCH